MSKYSAIEKLIIILLTVGFFTIPAIFAGKKDAKKKKEEDEKRKEQKKKAQEEDDRKFREDKNNIANIIDQSIYDKVDFADDDKDLAEKLIIWINKYVLPKLLSSSYKQSIKDAINEAIADGYLDNNYKNYIPTIKAEYFDSDIILLIDDDQEIRDVCLFVIEDIASIVRKALGRKIGTGDGDEGCIYL